MQDFERFRDPLTPAREALTRLLVNLSLERLEITGQAAGAAHVAQIGDELADIAIIDRDPIDIEHGVAKAGRGQQFGKGRSVEHGMESLDGAAAGTLGVEQSAAQALEAAPAERGAEQPAARHQRMAYRDFRVERFLALNGLAGNARLAPGTKVKLVVYGSRRG